MKTRARIVSGLAALAALFLAPLAEASLTRVTAPATESRALALSSPAPEPSEFSLFTGDEVARSLDAPRASAEAGRFHLLAAVSLLYINGAEAPLVSADPPRFRKTRIGVFDFLGSRIIGVERGVSLELQWGSGRLGLETSEGIGIWLSQDPMGDKDSPNLYSFVGMRPHEKTDPLGLLTSWRAEVGPGDVLSTVDIESGNKLVDATVLATLNTALNIVGGAVNTATNLLYIPQHLGEEGLRKIGWTDTDIEALRFYAMANPAEVAAAMSGLRAGVSQGTAELSRLMQRIRQAKNAAPAPVLRSVGAAANAELQTAKAAPPTRPSWQTSEGGFAEELKPFGLEKQKSYVGGKEVPYNTPGSVRPDLASESMKLSVDVKNYNVATPQGRYRLVTNILEQVEQRTQHLPQGMRQSVILDIRGQTVSEKLLEAMITRIVMKSNGAITAENVFVQR
jgi:hypothetical protein